MRAHKMVSVVTLFLLVVGYILVVRAPVYAWKYECCMCMACSHLLCHYCMGESTTCGYCGVPEPETLQAKAAFLNDMVDIRAVRAPVRATVMSSDFAQSFLARMSGDRASRNLALTLAKHPDYKLTIWCPGSPKTKDSQTNLALHTDNEEQ